MRIQLLITVLLVIKKPQPLFAASVVDILLFSNVSDRWVSDKHITSKSENIFSMNSILLRMLLMFKWASDRCDVESDELLLSIDQQ